MSWSSYDEESKQVILKPSPAAKRRSINKTIIIIASIIAILIGGVLIEYQMRIAPMNEMKAKLDSGDVDAAKAIYLKQIKGSSTEEDTLQFLRARSTAIAAQYKQKTLTSEQAIEQLMQIFDLGIDLGDQPWRDIYSIKDLQRSRQSFADAEAFLAQKDYPSAILEFQKVIVSDEDFQTAQTRLAAAIEIYRADVLEQVETLMAESKLTETVAELEYALTIVIYDPVINAMWMQYHKQLDDINRAAALAAADTFWRRGDMQNALDTLRTALQTIPADAEMTAVLSNYTKQIVDSTLAAIHTELTSGNIKSALEIVNGALLVVPLESTLNDKKTEIIDLQEASDKRVKDDVDSLSAREEAKLTNKLDIMSYHFDLDIAVIVLLGNLPSTQADAERLYHGYHYGYHDTEDGILLIIYYYQSEFGILTMGDASEKITEAEHDSIADSVSDATYTGDWNSAVLKFISVTTRALEN